ncbi:MAG: hypothetical protein LBU46_01535, partial [Candidatus Accumulibacter sp.]|nr:hypothetical protein [Accumulibacter sp.]
KTCSTHASPVGAHGVRPLRFRRRFRAHARGLNKPCAVWREGVAMGDDAGQCSNYATFQTFMNDYKKSAMVPAIMHLPWLVPLRPMAQCADW